MPDFSKKIVYLSQAQYQELITNGMITVDGVTVTYNANDIYVTPQAEPVTDVQVNGTSITSNGVANVPIGSTTTPGLLQANNYYGTQIYGIATDGKIGTLPASDAEIKAGSVDHKVIAPKRQHMSVFFGLAKAAGDTTQPSSANAMGTYTDAAKAAIQLMLGSDTVIGPDESSGAASQPYAIGDFFTMGGALYKVTAAIAQDGTITVGTNCVATCVADELAARVRDVQVNGATVVSGGVASIPAADSNTFGVIRPNNNSFDFYNGGMIIRAAGESEVKNGTNSTKALVPGRSDSTAFYGLAKAAGADMKNISSTTVGTYPDTQKAAIQRMLGITSVIGDEETTGAASRAYVPGEYFLMNGVLYRVTSDIAQDGTITVGTNCVETKLSKEIYPKRIVNKEINGDWYKISVTAIDYTNGILTLEDNDASFTDDFSTTCEIMFVPILEGVHSLNQYRIGMLPEELFKLSDSVIKGVLVGPNQIKVAKNSTTYITSITEQDRIDLTRWKVFARKNNGEKYIKYTINDKHRYRIELFNPYGCHYYSCSPYIMDPSAIVPSNYYGEGYGKGYRALGFTVSGNLSSVVLKGSNSYEYLPRYMVEGYGTPSYADGGGWRSLPNYFNAELYPISDATWIFDTKFSFFPANGTYSKNDIPGFFTINNTAYINSDAGVPGAIYVRLQHEGTRFSIYDLGEML